MHKKLFYVFILILASYSCKKENDRPQWDVDVLGPLAYASLGLEELIGDTSIQSLENGALFINYDTTFSEFEIDSLYKFTDTTISTLEFFPPFPATLPANSIFPVDSNDISLGIGGVQLKQAIIRSGKIRVEIKNVLQTKVIFVYTIPKAKKNGISFSITASVDSASGTDPKFFIGEYDLDGYDFDLTGDGNSFNSISYKVDARSDPNGFPFNVLGNDTLVNLKTTLLDVQPNFVRGYLGQTLTNASVSANIGIGALIKSGTIALDSIKMNLDITNYIGADAQIVIPNFSSVNNSTGNIADLIAPTFIQNYININRASINPTLADSLVPTYYSIQLDKSNSNIVDLIENLPDKLNYEINLNLNPLGNISGSNDFVFRDRLINTRLRLHMPLRFAANQLTLSDTVPFTISGATDFEPVGFTKLTLIADNGFPFDLNVQLFLLDSNQVVVDSILSPGLINAAPFDVNFRAVGFRETLLDIPVDEVRKDKLLNVQQMVIRLQFTTPDYPQLFQLYSNYRLDLKLIADGKYSIR